MSNKNITKNLVNTHSESIDWSVIQKDMRTKLGNDIYESWLRKIDFVEEMNNYVLLSVSTRFIRDWITSRYLDQILKIVKIYKKDLSRMKKTYILKNKDDLAGYFELIFHKDKKEVEIAYLGLLEEYYNKKLGSYLLSAAIRNSFSDKIKRVWVHTCSLDHQNALNNYLSRGMKIFKKETISI